MEACPQSVLKHDFNKLLSIFCESSRNVCVISPSFLLFSVAAQKPKAFLCVGKFVLLFSLILVVPFFVASSSVSSSKCSVPDEENTLFYYDDSKQDHSYVGHEEEKIKKIENIFTIPNRMISSVYTLQQHNQHTPFNPLSPNATELHLNDELSGFGGRGGEGFDDGAAYDIFLQEYSDRYSVEIESLRRNQLKRFKNEFYLDYAGSGLYRDDQLRKIFEDLMVSPYGNAHSRNPSAFLTDTRLLEAREKLLQFVNAQPSEYAVIFTSGATGGLKMIGEDFTWERPSRFYYLRINHNSVLGIREYAYSHNVEEIRAVSEEEVQAILSLQKKRYLQRISNYTSNEENIDDEKIREYERKRKLSLPACLFAYPAKDNFNANYYPSSWNNDVEKFGLTDDCNWFVLLDAAAFAGTHPLNMQTYKPAFCVISFYKIFGYPTGLGAVLVRKDVVDSHIKKLYWGGGSVIASVCDSRWCKAKDNPSLRFEDGTVSFLSIAAIRYGFEAIQEAGGIEKISQHIGALTAYLFSVINDLTHYNGNPMIHTYWNKPYPPTGGVLNFNVLNPDGSFVAFTLVEYLAAENHIHLRTGCFCNPGGCQDYVGLDIEEIKKTSETRTSCSDGAFTTIYIKKRNKLIYSDQNNSKYYNGHEICEHEHDPTCMPVNKPLGSVRVSFGYLSTFEDLRKFVLFLIKHFRK